MKTAVASALALALAFAGASGCTSGHAKTTPAAAVSSPDTTPAPQAVTPEVATAAFRTFVTNDDVARASGDERLALWWTSEGQSQLTAAAFRRAMAAGDPVPRYRYDSPALYVPRLLPESVQWFVATARRTTLDGKDPQNVIMGFIRSKPTMRWRLSLLAQLDKKQKPPKIAVDDQGYAKPLATFDTNLLIPPRVVPSIQATLAEEGPGNVAAKVMATGKHTTDYYTSDQKATKAAAKTTTKITPKPTSKPTPKASPKATGKPTKATKKSTTVNIGLKINTVYSATSFPIFPLATTDGGGIILYALSRDAVYSKSKKKPGVVPVPEDVSPFVDADKVKNELDVNQTLQFAALVPPKPGKDATDPAADAKAVVFAADGGIIRATVPNKH